MTSNVEITVVIVDDSTVMRSMLHTIFTHEGFTATKEFSSGRGLIEKLAKEPPDIICLDYNLPGSNGLELLQEIHSRHPEIAVVMITGNESPELEKAAAEAGASGFIHKPFTPGSIVKTIHHVALAHKFVNTRQLGESLPLEEARASVVIADDSRTMRQLLGAILEQINVQVVGEASNGEQAVALVTELKPDLVFLDIEMPVMTGLEALHKIKSQQPATQALIVTSRAERECVIEAVKIGAKGYILKPYQPNQVMDQVQTLLH